MSENGAISLNNSKGELSSCRCSTWHHMVKSKDNEYGMWLLIPHFVSICAKRFSPGRCSFLGQKRSQYSTYDRKPQGEWDRVAELMLIKFGESGHPVLRATSPLSQRNPQKQRRWIIINAILCRWWCDRNRFSHKFFCQSGQYPRSSLSFVWIIQSLPCKNGETCDLKKFVDENTYTFDRDPAQEDLLQKYKERLERLSQQNRVIKICTGVGQFFMTKDTEEFSQFTESVACREYICQEMKNHLTRKIGFEGTHLTHFSRQQTHW